MGRFDTLEVIHKVGDVWTCRCAVCGKWHKFDKCDFVIKKSEDHKIGYYSDVYCDCHAISSFQWRTMDILNKYDIDYQSEYTFSALRGVNGGSLRFDFAIFNKSSSKVKCFIECQGMQHYKPVAEFGGEDKFKTQQENDKKKRNYLRERNIELIELDYKQCSTYANEETVLKQKGII